MYQDQAVPRGKKTNRNEDRHVQPRLAFHLPQELFDAFKQHVKGMSPKPAESEVLRVALEQYLARLGAWPPPSPAPED